LKFCVQFLRFFGKRPLWHNSENSVPEVFTASPIDVVVFKFGGREICEIVHYLPDKNKISPVSQTVAAAPIAPKILQGQLPTMYSE